MKWGESVLKFLLFEHLLSDCDAKKSVSSCTLHRKALISIKLQKIIKILHLHSMCNLNSFPCSEETGWSSVFSSFSSE